jgi:hypothetical protein
MPFKILNPHPKQHLTADDIEVRIWGFVVVVVTLILCFIVAAMLYSVIFVVQPIKSMAPIDQAFTKMLNDIVLLIVGGIGGVMSKRATRAVAEAMAPKPTTPPTAPPAASAPTEVTPSPKPPAHPVVPDWNWMGYKNPDLDESWTPPPPPTTPADHIHPEAEEIAQERAAARSEA